MTEKAALFRARSTLIGLTLVWGSTFVAIQTALEVVSPFALIAIRFGLTAIVLGAFKPAAVRGALHVLRRTWPLAIAQFAGFALQTTGMKTTTPGHSAFITSLFVVMVPLFELWRRRHWPKKRLLAAALIATCGIVTLFAPFEGHWKVGDTLTIFSAVAFAFYIVELQRLAQSIPPFELVIAQSLCIAAMALPCAFFLEPLRLVLSPTFFGVVGYLTVVCTMLTFVLMTRAQKVVTAMEAAVIYTLEPVIAASLSIAMGREAFSVQFLVGAILVLSSTLIAALTPEP